MTVLDTAGCVLRIHAPEWFRLPIFRAWLEDGTRPDQRQRLATFHRHGSIPGEYSDVFITFGTCPIGLDESGRTQLTVEGSDLYSAEGLEDIWSEIVAVVQELQLTHGIIWISNQDADGEWRAEQPAS